MRTVTCLCDSDSLIQSEYGEIPYKDWCKKEISRINDNGGSVELYESGSLCAIKNK